MAENDKAELLEMLNKAVENFQHVIETDTDDVNKYFKLKSGWQKIVYELIKIADARGYNVIWKGDNTIKIVEKEKEKGENDGKTKEEF